MLDLCPRPLVKAFPRVLQEQAAKVLTSAAIAGAGAFYNTGSARLLPRLNNLQTAVSKIRTAAHGSFRCPLCGGTRSFLAMLKGDTLSALHFSIFGTFVFLATFGLVPLRIWALITGSSRFLTLISRIDDKLQKYFLHILFTAYCLQLLLNKSGILIWAA
ncbi:MAG: DUF2752 domain-containing protein [Firmicutes bacterium]|nr:DUF2752 domain-containing protein [Bacillota bacterium]